MANPTGKSGPRDKPYRDALRRAIARAETLDDPHALDRIAEQHLAKAAAGDMQAVKELADRIDGKVPQGIIGGDEDDPAIAVSVIERRIVDSPNPDGKSVPPAAGTQPV